MLLSTNPNVLRIAARAARLINEAESLGVSLRIDRVPLRPLAMGYAKHVIEAWPAHQPRGPVGHGHVEPRPDGTKVRCGGPAFCSSCRRQQDAAAAKDAPLESGEAHAQPYPSPARREISDREWAAQSAGMREGCTVHVPGVGSL